MRGAELTPRLNLYRFPDLVNDLYLFAADLLAAEPHETTFFGGARHTVRDLYYPALIGVSLFRRDFRPQQCGNGAAVLQGSLFHIRSRELFRLAPLVVRRVGDDVRDDLAEQRIFRGPLPAFDDGVGHRRHLLY